MLMKKPNTNRLNLSFENLVLLRTKVSEAGPLAGPFPSREAGSRRLPSLLREYVVYGNVKQQSGRRYQTSLNIHFFRKTTPGISPEPLTINKGDLLLY